MTELRIAFLGDIVGSPGRRAAIAAAERLRSDHAADLVLANAENATHGAGLSDAAYRELRAGGIAALTLGDHCYDVRSILPVLEDENEPIARPANLAAGAPGKRLIRIEHAGQPIYVVSVLGRLYMQALAGDPFAAVDELVSRAGEPDAIVLVEIHAEATSEKIAMAWHCAQRWPRRVAAVLGSHTHVLTADARILEHMTAAITDLGMTGPHRSVIGRRVRDVLRRMVDQAPTALEVAGEDLRAQGALLRIDRSGCRALGIECFDLPIPA